MILDCSTLSLEAVVSKLCERIVSLLEEQSRTPHQRLLIALAGVPGSGKSTISGALLQALVVQGIDTIAVLPMDGYHYPKASLAQFPEPLLAYRRRGAPYTFDATAFLEIVSAIKGQFVTFEDDPETLLKAPSFDHGRQDPVTDDVIISSRIKLVIIEGNYTLLNEDPWHKIAKLVDQKWFVDVDPDVGKERLIARHLRAGIESSRAAAKQRVEDNDLVNAKLIRSRLIAPDLTVLC